MQAWGDLHAALRISEQNAGSILLISLIEIDSTIEGMFGKNVTVCVIKKPKSYVNPCSKNYLSKQFNFQSICQPSELIFFSKWIDLAGFYIINRILEDYPSIAVSYYKNHDLNGVASRSLWDVLVKFLVNIYWGVDITVYATDEASYLYKYNCPVEVSTRQVGVIDTKFETVDFPNIKNEKKTILYIDSFENDNSKYWNSLIIEASDILSVLSVHYNLVYKSHPRVGVINELITHCDCEMQTNLPVEFINLSEIDSVVSFTSTALNRVNITAISMIELLESMPKTEKTRYKKMLSNEIIFVKTEKDLQNHI